MWIVSRSFFFLLLPIFVKSREIIMSSFFSSLPSCLRGTTTCWAKLARVTFNDCEWMEERCIWSSLKNIQTTSINQQLHNFNRKCSHFFNIIKRRPKWTAPCYSTDVLLTKQLDKLNWLCSHRDKDTSWNSPCERNWMTSHVLNFCFFFLFCFIFFPHYHFVISGRKVSCWK